MATELKETVARILTSNEPTVIATEVVDLLVQTRKPGAYEDALALLYPRFDHVEAIADYVAERERAISTSPVPSAQ